MKKQKYGRKVLTQAKAEQIRRLYRSGKGAWGLQTALAKQFWVTRQQISLIIQGKCWVS
jgi:DNA invertase Pin-like site-specific DNA recombinase